MDYSAEFAGLASATVSDALRNAGAPHQVLHRDLRPIGAQRAYAAPAFCVTGERVLGTIKASDDRRFEMYRAVPQGAAVILATGGYDGAVAFGENVALSLKMKGCKAIVTDGGIRDREAMVEMDMPLHARFVSPLSAGKQWVTLAFDRPVAMPGESTAVVMVHPGDIVVGDADGVAIVPLAIAGKVLEIARHAGAAEERTRARILAGEDPQAAYAAEPRYAKPGA